MPFARAFLAKSVVLNGGSGVIGDDRTLADADNREISGEISRSSEQRKRADERKRKLKTELNFVRLQRYDDDERTAASRGDANKAKRERKAQAR